MNDTDSASDQKIIMMIVGAMAAAAVAGLIGSVVVRSRRPPEERVRDVKDIIKHCQATISQLDRTLQEIKAT